ncbi:MAG TPA: Fic/DOC family N-terminal domain-containing protein [Intrasporangium sp.]|uniref:Fic family protein n=1 Tax=Intrasporangium sp. TaxID=1925024 RepID=UPI002F94AE46
MDLKRFEASPIGTLAPINGYDTLLKREYRHAAFVPAKLPHEVPLGQGTYKKLAEAERAVGRLDAAADRLPNPNLLVRPTLYREAVSTSALEGTYAPLLEVLEADYVDERRQSQEVREVLNYVRAAGRGLELIEQKPICLTVIAELQKILVRGTRGDLADSGWLRTGQVYIGERSRGIEAARFVPPPAGDPLAEGMSDWEKWLNAEDDVPLLVKAALGHYQFETLHPFSDGNGRLGRLIIVLQLIAEGALRYPILNLSPYFEPRKDTYKDLLLGTSATGNFEPWVAFFADAVIAQAADAEARITRLLSLRQEMLGALRAEKARGVVLDIVEDLIGYPVITVSQAAKLHSVTFPPANNAIERLVRLGFLVEMTGRGYGRVFACPDVMATVEDPHLT